MKRLIGISLCLLGIFTAHGSAYAAAHIIYDPGDPETPEPVWIADTGLNAGQQAYLLKHYLCAIKDPGTLCLKVNLTENGEAT